MEKKIDLAEFVDLRSFNRCEAQESFNRENDLLFLFVNVGGGR